MFLLKIRFFIEVKEGLIPILGFYWNAGEGFWAKEKFQRQRKKKEGREKGRKDEQKKCKLFQVYDLT